MTTNFHCAVAGPSLARTPRRAVTLALVLLSLAAASHLQAAEPPKGRKVSVKDLEGFGKDISEIDLEKMIEEQQSKVGVASRKSCMALSMRSRSR